MAVIETEKQLREPVQTAKEQRTISDNVVTVIEPSHEWFSLKIGELWKHRELLYFLVWAEIKAKYKQTAIGMTWAIIQPFMTMLAFTVIFEKIAKMPSEGLPYPLFSFTALVPWNYFAKSFQNSTTSVTSYAHLITKVYFPRLLLPLNAALSGLVDFCISFIFLLAIMAWYHFPLTWRLLTLPLFVLLAMLTALSISLWLSVINVRYRDVGQAIPFLVQFWLFASPVAYPVSVVPEKWRLLYGLNPMTGVIEGFRWALLGKDSPPAGLLLLSVIIVMALLWGGVIFFKRMERTFVDVV